MCWLFDNPNCCDEVSVWRDALPFVCFAIVDCGDIFGDCVLLSADAAVWNLSVLVADLCLYDDAAPVFVSVVDHGDFADELFLVPRGLLFPTL